MHLKIAVLPGDYIGPEVMSAALPVLEAVLRKSGHTLEHSTHPVGGAGIDAHGKALPDSTLAACQAADAILFGSVGGPKWEKLPPKEQPERASLLPLRSHFRLFANVRPGLLPKALLETSPLRADRIAGGIDMVCIRELTGGLYFGPSGTEDLPDGQQRAYSTAVYTTSEVERIVRMAAEAARKRRGKLTMVDKANVLEASRLWRRTSARIMKEEFPDLEYEVVLVDSMAMHLLSRPKSFDVVVTSNMFGDILTDEASMLPGSLGMLPSASLGSNGPGLYEPIHGSAPDIAGKGIANPLATILAAAMLLRHSLNLEAEAAVIETAVKNVLAQGFRTADLAPKGSPTLSTIAITDKVLESLDKA